MYKPKSSLFEAFFTTLPPCGCSSVAQRSRLSASLRRARPRSSLFHLRGLDSPCSVISSPHRRGRGRGAAADGSQASELGDSLSAARRTRGPLRQLQQEGPPSLPLMVPSPFSWYVEYS